MGQTINSTNEDSPHSEVVLFQRSISPSGLNSAVDYSLFLGVLVYPPGANVIVSKWLPACYWFVRSCMFSQDG